MAESQHPTVNAAPQGNLPAYVPQCDEKVLHMENALCHVNKNNALLQRQIEILKQENQQLMTENANIRERLRDTHAAPQGFQCCNQSATSLEEVHYVKNAAIIAYQQNVYLRNHLQSLLQHNQYLQAEMAKTGHKQESFEELVGKNTMFYDQMEQVKSEKAKILQQNDQLKAEIKTISLENTLLKDENTKIERTANAERINICRLEGLLKARKKEFNAQKQELQETIAANDNQINLLTQHLEMLEEESKFRESTFKEEHSKMSALLSQERKKVVQQQKQIAKASLTNQRNDEKLQELQQNINELLVQLSLRDTEILQLKDEVLVLQRDSQKLSDITEQLQAKEAENSLMADEWRKKYNCLEERLTKELSEKKQSWEMRFKEVEEEKTGLQREKHKLLEENTQLKEEREEKKRLEKQNTELMQHKIKLEEDMAGLKERFLDLQTKKKKGFWSSLRTKKRQDREAQELSARY